MSIKPALNQMILRVSSCQTFFKIDSQLGMDLPQPCLCPVHFFVMSTVARYSILNRLSSVGNTVFAFVTFLSCRLKPSIALVVWISRLTPFRVLETGGKGCPVVMPGLVYLRIFGIPFLPKQFQFL